MQAIRDFASIFRYKENRKPLTYYVIIILPILVHAYSYRISNIQLFIYYTSSLFFPNYPF
jgi:hypothetical protein